MKNIEEILKDFGITVPADQTAAFNKAVAENYKTVAEVDKKIGKLEQERDSLREQFETASNTLKGFEGVNVDEMNRKLADYQKQAEDLKADYDKKIAERDFTDALNAEMGKVKFTSQAARNAVMNDIRAAGLKMQDGKILGLNDLMTSIREKDAGAFVDEETKPAARFTGRMTTGEGKKYSSAEEIMKIKSPKERQQAISDNMDLFG